mgnify:CR=1 FL=1
MKSTHIDKSLISAWSTLSNIAGILVLLELAETNRLPKSILLNKRKAKSLLKNLNCFKINKISDVKDELLASELALAKLTQSAVNSVYEIVKKEKLSKKELEKILRERLPKSLKSRASNFILSREEIKGYEGANIASKILTGSVLFKLGRTQSIAYFKKIDQILTEADTHLELSANLTELIRNRIFTTSCIELTDWSKVGIDDL